jgi:glc operon protein GlcG
MLISLENDSMLRSIRPAAVLFLSFWMLASPASAQRWPNPYGLSINLESAKKAAASALAETRRNDWTMAVAIVDTAGNLVYFEKLDGTQTASVNVAIAKARSSVLFKRPTKAFEEALKGGGSATLRLLAMDNVVPDEGGIPLVMAGAIVGAIGMSGGTTAAQDGQCAAAGAAALK